MLVPDDFEVPRELVAERFRLEPLGARHNDADYAAWTSSVEHIRATPGFQGNWPPVAGMSPADNLGDLKEHADDFAKRTGFTYIYPSRDEEYDVEVRSWVRADRGELDTPLYEAVSSWLSDWPLGTVKYR